MSSEGLHKGFLEVSFMVRPAFARLLAVLHLDNISASLSDVGNYGLARVGLQPFSPAAQAA